MIFKVCELVVHLTENVR